jgi:hypothetical protein
MTQDVRPEPMALSYRTSAMSDFRSSEAIALPIQPSKTFRTDFRHSVTTECLGLVERNSLSIDWKSLISCCLAAKSSSNSSIRSRSPFKRSRRVRWCAFVEALPGVSDVPSSTRDIVIGPLMLITRADFEVPLSKCFPPLRRIL